MTGVEKHKTNSAKKRKCTNKTFHRNDNRAPFYILQYQFVLFGPVPAEMNDHRLKLIHVLQYIAWSQGPTRLQLNCIAMIRKADFLLYFSDLFIQKKSVFRSSRRIGSKKSDHDILRQST